MSGTAIHNIWVGILTRCYNQNARAFKNYGGRGIKVHERWLDFRNFYADVGPRPSPQHSIDRFPNKDGNYEPGNVRWATSTDQANNQRSNRLLTVDGETHTLAEWARLRDLPLSTLAGRLKIGWDVKDAIMTPKSENVVAAMHAWSENLSASERSELSRKASSKRWEKHTEKNLFINGESMSVAGWSRRTGIKRTTLELRLSKGMDPAVAISTPVRTSGRLSIKKG